MKFCNRTMLVFRFHAFTPTRNANVSLSETRVFTPFHREQCDYTNIHTYIYNIDKQKQRSKQESVVFRCIIKTDRNEFALFSFQRQATAACAGAVVVTVVVVSFYLCIFVYETIPKATEEENALIENFGIRWMVLMLLLLHQTKCASEC